MLVHVTVCAVAIAGSGKMYCHTHDFQPLTLPLPSRVPVTS